MTDDTDPDLQRRVLAAPSATEAARILSEECGYGTGIALEAAGLMRGESQGDVIRPRPVANVTANP